MRKQGKTISAFPKRLGFEFRKAQARGRKVRANGYAVSAKFERGSLHVEMNSGLRFSIPVGVISDLDGAPASKLSEIEITSTGLGLHWPQLDVDLYVPGLLMNQIRSEEHGLCARGNRR